MVSLNTTASCINNPDFFPGQPPWLSDRAVHIISSREVLSAQTRSAWICYCVVQNTSCTPSQIARLYRPLDTDAAEEYSDSDSDSLAGTQLLPTHHHSRVPANSDRPGKGKPANRLRDVWDEREELFGIGESDEDVDADDDGVGHVPQLPKITVTSV